MSGVPISYLSLKRPRTFDGVPIFTAIYRTADGSLYILRRVAEEPLVPDRRAPAERPGDAPRAEPVESPIEPGHEAAGVPALPVPVVEELALLTRSKALSRLDLRSFASAPSFFSTCDRVPVQAVAPCCVAEVRLGPSGAVHAQLSHHVPLHPRSSRRLRILGWSIFPFARPVKARLRGWRVSVSANGALRLREWLFFTSGIRLYYMTQLIERFTGYLTGIYRVF